MNFDRAYFDRQYRDYERQNPPRKMAFYRFLAECAARGNARPRILDYGCAFGRFLASLDDRWERCGIDVSEYAIRDASSRYPGIRFKSCAPGAYPDWGGFDVVTAFDVLEHLRNPAETLDWIHGALRQGGILAVVVPVYDGPSGPVIRLLDRDPTHIHRESRRFWLDLVGRGFRLIEWWGVLRYLLPGGYYMHLVTRRWREFTPAVACMFSRD